MPGKRPRENGHALRLASGRQLFVLNREGLLQLADTPGSNPDNALTSADADIAIRTSIEANSSTEEEIRAVP